MMNPSKLAVPIPLLLGLVALLLVVRPAELAAQPTQAWRCSTDRLDATAALQRLEWARRCALTRNTTGPNSWVASTKAFDTTFNWAKEYVENNSSKAFSGNLNSFNVNYQYAYARYQTTPIYTVFQETSGPTAGFWKWSHHTQRPRMLYPTFESTPVAGGGTQLFPLPTMPGSDCDLFSLDAGTGSYTRWSIIASFFVVAYCEVDP